VNYFICKLAADEGGGSAEGTSDGSARLAELGEGELEYLLSYKKKLRK